MKTVLIRLLLTLTVICYSLFSISAQKNIGECNDIEFSVSSGACSSGFLEFTVTAMNSNSNTSNTSMASVEITFPGNRTVEKTGASMDSKTSMDATPIVFTSFTNTLDGQESETCTFRTMGCDPLMVTFTATDAGCNTSTMLPTQTITYLNPVAVQDPCNCNDPQNVLNADGSVRFFHDVMTFTGTSGDAIACVTNCPAILDNTGAAQNFGTLNLMIPVSGTLTHDFWRAPGTYAQTDFTVGGITAILAAGNCDGTVCNNNIPTMGEWGLIILSLFLMIFGLVAVKVKQTEVVSK